MKFTLFLILCVMAVIAQGSVNAALIKKESTPGDIGMNQIEKESNTDVKDRQHFLRPKRFINSLAEGLVSGVGQSFGSLLGGGGNNGGGGGYNGGGGGYNDYGGNPFSHDDMPERGNRRYRKQPSGGSRFSGRSGRFGRF